MRLKRLAPYFVLIAVGLAGSSLAIRAGGLVASIDLPFHAATQLVSTGAAYAAARSAHAERPLIVPDEEESIRSALESRALVPVLANNHVLAFYGNPLSRRMGILGEYSKEEITSILLDYAARYDKVNGELGVVPAFYLLYGICWPDGEIGYLKESLLKEYIDYAASRGILVFVDHQIGKYGVENAMEKILPFLKYPNVHLALDPEWRTTSPMKEIGSVSAAELNMAQEMMRDYILREGLPGSRMLVVHQFKSVMIRGRERVKADFDRVVLVHTADGFGSPALKRNTYAFNARARNMPTKGFKLFFKTLVPGAGYDDPLLSPAEVLALDPQPSLIIYQ